MYVITVARRLGANAEHKKLFVFPSCSVLKLPSYISFIMAAALIGDEILLSNDTKVSTEVALGDSEFVMICAFV